MKLLYLINQYPKVSHSFIRREIRELESRGVEVQRVSVRGWDAALADSRDLEERARTRYILESSLVSLVVSVVATVVLHPVRFARALRASLRILGTAPSSFAGRLICLVEACHTVHKLMYPGVSHIHAHFGTNSSEIALYAALLADLGFSFTIHGQDELLYPGLLEKVRNAAFVVAISSFGRSQLMKRLPPAHWTKFRLIRCGLPADLFASTPSEPDQRTLLCVARISPEKGHLVLLDAIHRLVSEHVDLALVLIGEDEMNREIHRSVERLCLSSRVQIRGALDQAEVIAALDASRALVLPSFSEGMPIVIMEAMARAKPVVATFVGGVPELVESGTTGWLVPAGSTDALAEALRSVLDAPDHLVRRMGIAARNRCAQLHSLAKNCDDLLDAFLEQRDTRAS